MSIESQLAKATDETGWNEDSQITVLLEFLEREMALNPSISERFQEYLDEKVSFEMDEFQSEDDE